VEVIENKRKYTGKKKELDERKKEVENMCSENRGFRGCVVKKANLKNSFNINQSSLLQFLPAFSFYLQYLSFFFLLIKFVLMLEVFSNLVNNLFFGLIY